MKPFLFLLSAVFFSCPSMGWWTQKKAPPNSPVKDTQAKDRLQKAVRKIHLYMLQNGQPTFVQSGHALVIDQKHMITSIYNVGRFGKYPDHQLYYENNGTLTPCLVQYLDFFNGAALLYSSETLIHLPQQSDFDFTTALKQSPSEILHPNPNSHIVTPPQTHNDGIREFFQTQTTPSAHYSLAGTPLILPTNKIAGLYLGKIQGDEKEYIIPISKLNHLFEKARQSGDNAPAPTAPQRQFQSQFKVFQEKFIQTLSVEQSLTEPFQLSNWKITKIPGSLKCSISSGLKCKLKFPLMLDPYTESFLFELEFIPLKTEGEFNIHKQLQSLGEKNQSTFSDEPKCRQFRIIIQNEDSQFHFCTEKDVWMEETSHSLFRAVVSPKKNPMGIFLHLRSFQPTQITPLVRPIFSRAERIKE